MNIYQVCSPPPPPPSAPTTFLYLLKLCFNIIPIWPKSSRLHPRPSPAFYWKSRQRKYKNIYANFDDNIYLLIIVKIFASVLMHVKEVLLFWNLKNIFGHPGIKFLYSGVWLWCGCVLCDAVCADDSPEAWVSVGRVPSSRAIVTGIQSYQPP